MRTTGLMVFMALLVPLSACEKKPEYLRHRPVSKQMRPTDADVQLPVSLWDRLESLLQGGVPEKGGSAQNASFDPPVEFAPMKVWVSEKNPGIVENSHLELSFPEGGGELDLADFLVEGNGTFYMAFDLTIERGESPLHVFYLSNARKRKVGEEILGAGCKVYMDVSSYVRDVFQTTGFRVNTARERHVSLLAGTWFLATVVGGRLHVSQLTIKDSRYPRLQCVR